MWVDKGCRAQFIVYFTRTPTTPTTPTTPATPTTGTKLPKCGDVCPAPEAMCWDEGGVNGACNDLKCNLKIEHRQAVNAKWKLVNFVIYGTDERSQGKITAFVKLQKADGSFYGENDGKTFTSFWGSGWDKPDQEIVIKPKTGEWGDFAMTGTGWFPCTSGLTGPYGVYVGSRSSSDVVYGMGLPVNHHYSYYVIFREQ
jgi:hypothetical protein